MSPLPNPPIARHSITINDVFQKVLVLSPDRRLDRSASTAAQARRHGIMLQRFPAVDDRATPIVAGWEAYAAGGLVRHPPGGEAIRTQRDFYLGQACHEARVAYIEQARQAKAIASAAAWAFLASWINVLRRAIDGGWESVLLFGDDILLHRDTAGLFDRFIRQAPADWVVLQLGALQPRWDDGWIDWHSENLYRCKGSSAGAYAVGLRREVFPLLLEEAERRDLPFDIGALAAAKRRFPTRCLTMAPNLIVRPAAEDEADPPATLVGESQPGHGAVNGRLADCGFAAPQFGAAVREVGAVEETGAWLGGGNGLATPTHPGGELMNGATPNGSAAASVPASPAAAGFRLPRALRTALARMRGANGGGGDHPAPMARTAGSTRPQYKEQPLVPFKKEGRREPVAVVAVAVFGLAPEELGRVVRVVADQSARVGAVPVLMTDSDDFGPFRARGLPFEYFPPPEFGARLAPDLNWRLYQQRRLALFRRKWQPVRIVAFGPAAAAVLALWRESPFEDPTIAALIAAGDKSPVAHLP